MADRIFQYPTAFVTESFTDDPCFQMEIIEGKTRIWVNIGFVAASKGNFGNSVWITVPSVRQLDDLITALQYARLKLNKQEEN